MNKSLNCLVFVLSNTLGAKDYFLVIDGDNARLCLVYQTCQVIYEFRSDNDWKNFGIEIAASDVCQDYSACDTRPFSLRSCSTLRAILSPSSSYIL